MPDKLETQSQRATLASVKKEMALPRESKSAREALATNQPTNPPPRPRHLEDYKVDKLIRRIEATLALQARAIEEARQANSKN